jgi:hypothetical protein
MKKEQRERRKNEGRGRKSEEGDGRKKEEEGRMRSNLLHYCFWRPWVPRNKTSDPYSIEIASGAPPPQLREI